MIVASPHEGKKGKKNPAKGGRARDVFMCGPAIGGGVFPARVFLVCFWGVFDWWRTGGDYVSFPGEFFSSRESFFALSSLLHTRLMMRLLDVQTNDRKRLISLWERDLTTIH